MRKVIAVLALFLLDGCGGSSPSAPAPVPTPAPTPVPTFSGVYSGSMTFTGGGLNAVPVPATTTVTQTGTTIALSDLTLSGPFTGTIGLGSTTLNGNSFDGQSSYTSGGCGVVTSKFVGHFAGNLMNLTVTLTPPKVTGNCPVLDIRGELSRP